MVELLIARGANVKEVGPGGVTFLHVAAEGRNVHIVRVLLRAGLDINARTREGDTPLFKAELLHRTDIAAALRQAGATK